MEQDPAVQIFGSEEFDLYVTLELTKDASTEQIKKAYRRLALQCHPDKLQSATETEKESSVQKFQQIGYAYAVLSDSTRKTRYDSTGSTAEGVSFGPSGDATWDDYFKELWSGEVSATTIDEFFKTYEGSEEEKADILAAYNDSKGDLDHVLSHVMSRDGTTAEDRITAIIQDAITSKQLKATPKWKKAMTDTKAKAKRRQVAETEAQEAEEMAKELGVHEKLFGKAKGKGKQAKESDEDALRALVQQRGAKRMQDSIEALEAKYTSMEANKRSKRGTSKRKHTEDEDGAAEPTEAEFAALQAKLFGNKGKDKSKRAKH